MLHNSRLPSIHPDDPIRGTAMAYVRKRGNQIAIVHGDRDADSGNVQQRVLFTIYSQPEALEALGRGSEEGAHQFRAHLQREFPSIRFEWPKIERGIEENLSFLPESHSHGEERLSGQFRDDLRAFTRQLVHADPYLLAPAAKLVASHRHELEFLTELIKWRVHTCTRGRNEGMNDDPFYWRFARQGSDPGPEIEEMAEQVYLRGNLDRAEAVFRLLIECFAEYADGHNYLGHIALDRGKTDQAIEQFEEAAKIGLRTFPKRIAKDRYWDDLDTRPYVRAVRNLAQALEAAGRHEDSLRACERLERECGDNSYAASLRATTYLNTGRWEEGFEAASKVCEMWPSESFVAAFALFELGDIEESLVWFLHAALNRPRSACVLLGLRRLKIADWDGAEDHNEGVSQLHSMHEYLGNRASQAKKFFRGLMRLPQVVAMLDEVGHARHRSLSQREKGHLEVFHRVTEMSSPEYARERAGELVSLLFSIR